MGSFYRAETCELVGIYLLYYPSPKYGNNIGLCRDNGLAAFSKTPRKIENRKNIYAKHFSDNDLKITIEANKKCVNYLDTKLDLRTGSFKPFTKPNNIPQFVN